MSSCSCVYFSRAGEAFGHGCAQRSRKCRARPMWTRFPAWTSPWQPDAEQGLRRPAAGAGQSCVSRFPDCRKPGWFISRHKGTLLRCAASSLFQRSGPYRHANIATIILQEFFSGHEQMAVAEHTKDMFNPIPLPVIAFAATVVSRVVLGHRLRSHHAGAVRAA